jgi:hypothetical protein
MDGHSRPGYCGTRGGSSAGSPLIDRLAGFESQIAAALAGERYDVIFVEHFWLGPYVDLLRGYGDRVVCDLHNVESAFFTSLSRAEPWPGRLVHQRFAGLSEQLERRYLPRYSAALVTSEQDAARGDGSGAGPAAHGFPEHYPVARAAGRGAGANSRLFGQPRIPPESAGRCLVRPVRLGRLCSGRNRACAGASSG